MAIAFVHQYLQNENPARQRGWICACGIALEFSGDLANATSKCRACAAEYIKSGQQIQPVRT